jgi:two-component system phosphate regulon sensor histidine kinase PhoR
VKSIQKIGLLLALVFSLPALFFSAYEISSLNRDEKMIEEIYEKQLEAILFSVNQYSDDILSSWILRFEAGLNQPTGGASLPPKIENILSLHSALHALFVTDTVGHIASYRVFSLIDSSRALEKAVDQAMQQSVPRLRQLLSYRRSGFQKVETLPLPAVERKNLKCLVFVLDGPDQSHQIAGILIDPEIFVEEIIGPRLQVIAKDQFILSVFRKGGDRPIYSTLPSDTVKIAALTKDFWVFPEYAIGIRTNGASLQGVIDQRTNTNIFLLITLDVILIIAVILVFRNVKREVQLAQNKSDFVSNVSHEIRTPLALISMFAETLEMGRVKSEEKKQEYYSIIHKETHRLTGIVNKILNFSQVEANKKVLNVYSLDLNEQVKDILNTYDFHLRNKGFEFVFHEKPEKILVLADKEAFTEMVINLIDNAIKYSAEKKFIEIYTGRENGLGYVIVKDHGIGISKMDQKYIFDKFHRVSSGNLAKTAGTGLGLSLVKQLMEMHKGNVTVTSEPGQGSQFTLYFPLDPLKP